MAIPAKSPVYMKATLMGEPGDNVFDGTSQNVTIMRQASSKWWPIIKCVPTSEINTLLFFYTYITDCSDKIFRKHFWRQV